MESPSQSGLIESLATVDPLSLWSFSRSQRSEEGTESSTCLVMRLDPLKTSPHPRGTQSLKVTSLT